MNSDAIISCNVGSFQSVPQGLWSLTAPAVSKWSLIIVMSRFIEVLYKQVLRSSWPTQK